MKIKSIVLASALFLSACGTPWKTNPASQTALDQILISTAADRAADDLVKDYYGRRDDHRSLGKTFIDTDNFDTGESNPNNQYALSAIRRKFFDSDVVLVDDPDQADTIAEVGVGAMSVDNTTSLLGIPSVSLPIPLVGTVSTPEIAFYKQVSNRGLAKFAISLRDKQSGKIREQSSFSVGTAKIENWTVLVIFEFVSNDLELPEQYESIGGKSK